MKKIFVLIMPVGVSLIAAAAPAAVVTDNLVYNFDGDGQTASSWTSSTPAAGPADSTSRAWTMSGSVTTGLSGSTATNIVTAYNFAGGSGTSAAFAAQAIDASFELWIKPNSLTGKQVLFETGGTSKGLSLTLQNGTLWFAVKTNGNQTGNPNIVLSSAALTLANIGDYIQVVGVVSGSTTALYVNPVTTHSPAVAAATGVGVTSGSWNGGDAAGLAGSHGTGIGLGAGNETAGSGQWDWNTFTPFSGKIGLVRIYDDVLSGAEVADNFNAIVIPEPATLALLAIGGLLLATARKRGVR